MKNQFLEITDPIHDFIRLNSTEQKIIDTSVFQRLRRIKQLSGAHSVSYTHLTLPTICSV